MVLAFGERYRVYLVDVNDEGVATGLRIVSLSQSGRYVRGRLSFRTSLLYRDGTYEAETGTLNGRAKQILNMLADLPNPLRVHPCDVVQSLVWDPEESVVGWLPEWEPFKVLGLFGGFRFNVVA